MKDLDVHGVQDWAYSWQLPKRSESCKSVPEKVALLYPARTTPTKSNHKNTQSLTIHSFIWINKQFMFVLQNILRTYESPKTILYQKQFITLIHM